MTDPGEIRISLSSVRSDLSQLKPYLSQQFTTLPESIKNKYNQYVKILDMFRDSSDAYGVLLLQAREQLGPGNSYQYGTLGQKIFGCIRYESFSPDIVSCLPDCNSAVQGYTNSSCPNPIFQEAASGQLEQLSDSTHSTIWGQSPAVVILKTRNTLNAQDIAYLKSKGIGQVRRIIVDNTSPQNPILKTSPFEPLGSSSTLTTPPPVGAVDPAGRPTAVVPYTPATTNSSGSGAGGWLALLLIIILICAGVYYWKKRKSNKLITLDSAVLQ